MNRNQMLAIGIVILGVLSTSTAQLTDLFGPAVAHLIISGTSLTSAILAGVLGVITGQVGQIKDVQAMPGVDKVVINRRANSTLASMALDPGNDKVEAAPGAEATLVQTAKN